MQAYKTLVTFPYTHKQRVFKSERAVARMLSGNGTASGGLREQIARAAERGLTVRCNELQTMRSPWLQFVAQQTAIDTVLDELAAELERAAA
jgi:hypothetical protein